jgi:hypothetical protein
VSSSARQGRLKKMTKRSTPSLPGTSYQEVRKRFKTEDIRYLQNHNVPTQKPLFKKSIDAIIIKIHQRSLYGVQERQISHITPKELLFTDFYKGYVEMPPSANSYTATLRGVSIFQKENDLRQHDGQSIHQLGKKKASQASE